MTAHSPAPWRVRPENGFDVLEEGGRRIATAFQRRNLDGEDDDRSEQETEANARLIAAAPELLAACVRAKQYLKDTVFAATLLEQIDSAIAKAGRAA